MACTNNQRTNIVQSSFLQVRKYTVFQKIPFWKFLRTNPYISGDILKKAEFCKKLFFCLKTPRSPDLKATLKRLPLRGNCWIRYNRYFLVMKLMMKKFSFWQELSSNWPKIYETSESVSPMMCFQIDDPPVSKKCWWGGGGGRGLVRGGEGGSHVHRPRIPTCWSVYVILAFAIHICTFLNSI